MSKRVNIKFFLFLISILVDKMALSFVCCAFVWFECAQESSYMYNPIMLLDVKMLTNLNCS